MKSVRRCVFIYLCSDFENVYRTAQSQQGDVFTLKVKMNVKKKKHYEVH